MAARTACTVFFVSAVLATLTLAACSDNGPGSTGKTSDQAAKLDCGLLVFDADAVSGGTFTDYAHLSAPGSRTSFDPGVVQTLAETQITSALFDGLTDFDSTEKCSPVLKGAVAESWESNDDASEYTFAIKDGTTFSNGESVLPSSFKAAWERAGSAELASPYGFLVTYIDGGDTLQDGSSTALESIVADDVAMTLSVKLAGPNADFPAIVTHPFFSPADVADLEKVGNSTGWGTAGLTVGNGPFVLDAANEDEVVLTPNGRWAGNVYGDTEVKLDRLVFKHTADVETAYEAFERGEGDNATVPVGKLADAASTYQNNTITDPALGVSYFEFGSEDPQVGGDENVKLRQAISLAIDRDEINAEVYEGTRTVASGLVPPGMPGYVANLCHYCAHDVERAKGLYSDWVAGGGTLDRPVRIEFDAGGSHEMVAGIVAANVRDTLGIDIEFDEVAEDYFLSVAEPGGCQLCRSGWYADYPAYGNFMVDAFSAASIGLNNFGRFDDAAFERLIAEAQAEPDDAKRFRRYQQAEEVLLNTATAAIPLNWYSGGQVYRDSVANVDLPPLGIMVWERVSVGN